ncbi:FtsX-like permease family protein [Motilibacter deserti]|uniref:ABC transporter permease n=1 Tax=Motilibacter deserti TaxID=2714956 RepID=A0ABX0GRF4_9ACTN|nr:FtsX-like permease family protein [Motilibacter deserti]NHC12346.1 ABC transporter permease [Motilibacter deserti]
MTGLALRSVRHRLASFTATFLSALLGTVLIGSFATLVETANGPVSVADRETLVVMGAVVGGWGGLIVLFSVASTLAVAVRQRAAEIALLRAVGTTPRQARRLLRSEALVVTAAGAAVGALVALGTGRALLALLRSGGLVDASVRYAGGPPSLAASAAGVVLVSLAAASVTGRRSTSGPATTALRDAASNRSRLRWWRVVLGLVPVGYGVALGVVTVTVTADSTDQYAAMATSGSSSILVGVGLATLSPVLLRWSALLVRPALQGLGATGHLAAHNLTRRSHTLSAALAPVVVFTAGTIGTLMLVGIDARTLAVPVADGDTITLLNTVVTGMIALFAAIMVVNTFAAALAARRGELARLRLLGATPRQARTAVLVEAAVVAAVGVVVGGAASLATVVPFAVARDEGVVPDGQLWLPPLLAAAAVALTLGSAAAAARRVTSTGIRAGLAA